MVKIKQNYLLVFALICFIAINLKIRHDLRENKIVVAELKNEIGFQDKNVKTLEKMVDYSLDLGFRYNGEKLDQLLVTDSNFQENYFHSISFAKPCLVFCFSESHCQSCVETAVKHLKNVIGEKAEVMILGAFSDSRDLGIYMSSMSNKYITYRIPPMDPIFDINSIETPVFFILTPENKISDLFVFDVKYGDRLDKYLQHIAIVLK